MRRAHLPLIAAGLATFVVTLIAGLPARFVTQLLPANVTVGMLDGTLWSGRTDSLALDGNHLGALRWRLRPLQLFRARLALDAELNRNDGEVRGRLDLGFGNRIEARNLSGRLPVGALPAGIAPSGWSGVVQADLEKLSFRRGEVPLIEGTIELRDLRAPPPDGAAIGSYRLLFDGTFLQGQQLVGTLEDLEGPMQVTGTLSLGADRSYLVEGMVAPRAGASEAVTVTLRFLGAPDARGRRPFSLAGTY